MQTSYKSAQAVGDASFCAKCQLQTEMSGSNLCKRMETHLGGQWLVCCVIHSSPYVGLDTHGGTCIYMRVWCLAQGHRITACPAPCCARSPFSGVRRHPAGVSSTLIQEALQGVFWDWGVTHKSLSLSRHRAVLISEGGWKGIITPCGVLPQI